MYQVCPVCQGNGLVAAGFYSDTYSCMTPSPIRSRSKAKKPACRTCKGRGVIEIAPVQTNPARLAGIRVH